MMIIERDKWYYIIDCRNCDRPAVLGEAPASEEMARSAMPAFSWQCPHCRERQIVLGERVVRCQGIYV